jgi:hypothetical protein
MRRADHSSRGVLRTVVVWLCVITWKNNQPSTPELVRQKEVGLRTKERKLHHAIITFEWRKSEGTLFIHSGKLKQIKLTVDSLPRYFTPVERASSSLCETYSGSLTQWRREWSRSVPGVELQSVVLPTCNLRLFWDTSKCNLCALFSVGLRNKK